ncbi:hypothetical protein K883_04795 [Mycobacterium sp. TKK-01-0059]|nr:hypothetical protein K883_04795 [Mycobacterium sp. TKK-01-0059]
MSRPGSVPISERLADKHLACATPQPRRSCRRTDRDETGFGLRSGLSQELMCPSPPRGRDACGIACDLGAAKGAESDDRRRSAPLSSELRHHTTCPGLEKIQTGSHLGSTLKPGGAVLTRGVFRRSGSVACIRVDASPNEVLTRPIMHERSDAVKSLDSVSAIRYRPARDHFSTRPSSRPIVSMNSSTMSSTTERVGRTRSSEPTTCPTK